MANCPASHPPIPSHVYVTGGPPAAGMPLAPPARRLTVGVDRPAAAQYFSRDPVDRLRLGVVLWKACSLAPWRPARAPDKQGGARSFLAPPPTPVSH